jgi:hypothetical protein
MLSLAIFTLPAVAGVTCDTGTRHESLERAVADPACSVATLDAGTHFETVTVGRSFTIAGAGRDETILYCAQGPCIHATHGAEVTVLAKLSVASNGTVVEVWGDKLLLVDSRIAPLGFDGGGLKLRDTEAHLVDVELEVAKQRPALDALSSSRNTLDLERVHFSGVARKGGMKHAVYAHSYGVTCVGCTFEADRHFAIPRLMWDPLPAAQQHEPSRTSLYPERFCPAPDATAKRICATQCPDQDVALCDMSYQVGSQACVPEATCVPKGEIPVE